MPDRPDVSTTQSHDADAARAAARPWQPFVLPGALALLVAVAIGVDACRIGFFADDFHFLDAARRFSGWDLLCGAHGVWPWYRPASREIYFQVVQSFGSHRLAAAHTISLIVLLGVAGLLWRVGTRLLAPATVAVAIGLFLTYDFTKLLAATASGFQDLFALFWILMAVDAHMQGRRGLAMAATFLAPLAKETGFVVVPLLIALDLTVTRDRRPRGWTGCILAAALALGLHALARWSWPATGSAPRPALDFGQLPGAIADGIRGVVAPIPAAPPGAGTILCAALGVVALIALSRITTAPPRSPRPPEALTARFLAVATALGGLPVVAGHLLRLTLALGYHLFPAAPWASLLLAQGIARLPGGLRRVGVPALIAWNIAASGLVAPDLDRPESWTLGPEDWRWAVRLSAETRRLGEDLRHELPVRPESLLVLYDAVPAGTYLQTEDGPAARVLLDDPTVRSFRLNSPPGGIREDRLAILTFDVDRLHLETVSWSQSEILVRAMKALIAGRGDVASALLEFRASSDPARFDRAYARSAAALLLHGPARFLDGLGVAGLTDTAGSSPARLAAFLGREDPGLGAAMRAMLSEPRSGGAHVALADSLITRGVLPGAGVELRIAATLDPRRYGDRYRLALIMLRLGGPKEAAGELEALAADPGAGPLSDRARALAARVRKAMPPE